MVQSTSTCSMWSHVSCVPPVLSFRLPQSKNTGFPHQNSSRCFCPQFAEGSRVLWLQPQQVGLFNPRPGALAACLMAPVSSLTSPIATSPMLPGDCPTPVLTGLNTTGTNPQWSGPLPSNMMKAIIGGLCKALSVLTETFRQSRSCPSRRET